MEAAISLKTKNRSITMGLEVAAYRRTSRLVALGFSPATSPHSWVVGQFEAYADDHLGFGIPAPGFKQSRDPNRLRWIILTEWAGGWLFARSQRPAERESIHARRSAHHVRGQQERTAR